MEPENSREEKANLEIGNQILSSEVTPPRRGAPGLQTAWKVFLFLFLTMQIGPAAVFAIGSGLLRRQGGPYTAQFLLFLEAGNLAIVLALMGLLSLIEKRPFSAYGLPVRQAFRSNFGIGFLFGLAEASVLIGLIQVFGGYSFGSMALHGLEMFQWGLLHLVLFVLVGLYEESLFRGYPQFSLSMLVGFWPTAIVLSCAFGLVHLLNHGENWVGATSVVLVGLLFAFTLKRSGNLWYAVGLHAGFDWAQSFLYSVPDSGELLNGHLSNAVLRGPDWLTGGSVGPEASVFCFLTMGLQFLVVLWIFPAKKNEGSVQNESLQS
jgi:CAAX protease family protein